MSVAKLVTIAYFFIGLVVALLEFVKVIKISGILLSGIACANSGEITCLSGYIYDVVVFIINLVLGPILLIAFILMNIQLIIGIILIVIVIAIVVFLVWNSSQNNGGGAI